jgi:hypothetical protein
METLQSGMANMPISVEVWVSFGVSLDNEGVDISGILKG